MKIFAANDKKTTQALISHRYVLLSTIKFSRTSFFKNLIPQLKFHSVPQPLFNLNTFLFAIEKQKKKNKTNFCSQRYIIMTIAQCKDSKGLSKNN